MKRFIGLVTMVMILGAQSLVKAQEKILVWPNGPAVENGLQGKTVVQGDKISDNAEAVLNFYPVKDAKTCVLVCPGGGYHNLAYQHEGSMVAEMFNAAGVSAAVLHYRMPNGNCLIPITDVREAMKIVRAKMPSDAKVGIIGFSAGGHLASTAITHLDTSSADYARVRPDFGILVYPVITMTERTHAGSRKNLLGEKPSDALVAEYSNQFRVSPKTPPTILFFTTEDKTVPVMNGVWFYEALLKNNVPAELHIYAKGKHGFGMRKKDLPSDAWSETLKIWMKDMGFMK